MKVAAFFGRLKVVDGCWEWDGYSNQKGYGRTWWQTKRLSSHILAWQLSQGRIPSGMCVCHRCDNPRCCNPEHLFLGTNQDNVDDKVAKNRQARNRGAANNSATVTENDVRTIRALRARGETLNSIATSYGISAMQVSRIVRHKSWSQVL